MMPDAAERRADDMNRKQIVIEHKRGQTILDGDYEYRICICGAVVFTGGDEEKNYIFAGGEWSSFTFELVKER